MIALNNSEATFAISDSSTARLLAAVDADEQKPGQQQLQLNDDHDRAVFESDKRAVYKHPLFPLLALLFERCEQATQSNEMPSSADFNADIQAFIQMNLNGRAGAGAASLSGEQLDAHKLLLNDTEIDGLMIKAIQVLRIHLLELEKVQELCKDFCTRYITCLKSKMQSENLLRTSEYGCSQTGFATTTPLDVGNGDFGDCSSSGSGLFAQNSSHRSLTTVDAAFTATANGSCANRIRSDSESDSSSPVQYYNGRHLTAATVPSKERDLATTTTPYLNGSSSVGSNSSTTNSSGNDYHLASAANSPLSPAKTSVAAGSATSALAPALFLNHGSDCDDNRADYGAPMFASYLNTSPSGPQNVELLGERQTVVADATAGRKSKRGVLPKQATGVMRSWLFQHLCHPYPTEDEKRRIAAQTNLTLLQVNNWFINARRRILQPMIDSGIVPPTNVSNTLLSAHLLNATRASTAAHFNSFSSCPIDESSLDDCCDDDEDDDNDNDDEDDISDDCDDDEGSDGGGEDNDNHGHNVFSDNDNDNNRQHRKK